MFGIKYSFVTGEITFDLGTQYSQGYATKEQKSTIQQSKIRSGACRIDSVSCKSLIARSHSLPNSSFDVQPRALTHSVLERVSRTQQVHVIGGLRGADESVDITPKHCRGAHFNHLAKAKSHGSVLRLCIASPELNDNHA